MRQIKYIFLLSIIFFACDEINPVNDFSNDYTFLCILKSDQPTQKAYLYKAVNIVNINDVIPADAFILDAEIIMSDGIISSQLQVRENVPNTEEWLVYSDDSVFYGSILPNKKYDIQIKVNNEFVTGSTTIPGEFTINRLSSDTILYQDTNDSYKYIPISWSASANSFQYLVYSTIKYRSNDGREMERANKYTNTVNTFAKILFEPRYISYTYTGSSWVVDTEYHAYQIKFVVYALDKNYYDHVILSRDRAGLSAQYGVFGSMIADSYTIYVKY
jgi:hypothetical protein